MNKIFRCLILVSVITLGLVFLNSGYAQDTPPEGGFDDPDAPEIPIDGGVGFLAAAGITYGIKKVRDYRKNHLPDSN